MMAADMAHFLQSADSSGDCNLDLENMDTTIAKDCKQLVELSRLLTLPSEVLLHIMSSLDARSLCRLGVCCKKLQPFSQDELMWKDLCKRDYLLHEDCKGLGWRTLYMSYHCRYGRYHSTEIYRTIRRLWTRLEIWLRENDPAMYSRLRESCYHGEIKICEEVMRCQFPADLRCSLQIHNGQIENELGLHGCMSFGSYYRSEGLLDAAGMARSSSPDCILPGCLPLTRCMVSRISQYIAVEECGGFDVGSVIYPVSEGHTAGVFYAARSYTEWFTDLVESMESKFPRIDNKIYRFVSDPECVARSHGCFEVRAATCFSPDLSTLDPPSYLHIYRITMSMDEQASSSMSCRLETRHWVITDETGREEFVDGPGVVGEYPVMRPGEKFSWVSCCNLPTTYGNMKGFFCMKNLFTGEEVMITCPVFHMKCLPNETFVDFQQRCLQKKKNL